MRTRLAWASLFAALSACADPAILDLVVQVEEQGLDTLLLKVKRGEPPGALVYDCQLPFDTAATGTCPSEDGAGRWEEPGRLEVLLYGKPGTPLEVELEGLRDGRSATATSAISALPEVEGERRTLSLSLLGLTRERFRCGIQLEPLPGGEEPGQPEQQTALSVLPATSDSATPVVVVSARGRLALLRRQRIDPTCTLDLAYFDAAAATASWCYVSPDTLVTGPAQAAGAGLLVAATCATTPLRIVAAFRLPGAAGQRSLLIRRARRHLSPPVLANVADDARQEVVFYVRNGDTNDAPVQLIYWSPVDRGSGVVTTTTAINLPGVRFDGTMPAPLVLTEAGGHDRILVAGGTRSFGIVEGLQFRSLGTEQRHLRAPSARYDRDQRSFQLYAVDATAAHRRSYSPNGSEIEQQLPLLQPVTSNLEVRLALGSVVGDPEPELVLGQAGLVHVYDLAGAAVHGPFDVWGGTILSEQGVLLANLDRSPGAEIVTFAPAASKIYAIDGAGRALEGWPLEISGNDGRRHVLLTDLDPVRDERALRDVEVVTLSSGGLVEVITLGPGSYDPNETPWPLPARDGLGRGTYTSPADPNLTGVTLRQPSTQ